MARVYLLLEASFVRNQRTYRKLFVVSIASVETAKKVDAQSLKYDDRVFVYNYKPFVNIIK